MTLDQTRQLGIEFERRIQTMIPETENVSKLDTETIYSYLNQYQDKYIHDIYKMLDNIPSSSKPSIYIETIIQGLLKVVSYTAMSVKDGQYSIYLPDDFGLYLSSYTNVSDTYSYNNTDKINPGTIPNVLVSQSKMEELKMRPQDNMRIIRTPIACISKDRTIDVIFDRYTIPNGFGMSYYKVPKYMDLMTSTPCELPMDAFEDLVSGAVDLYVQYVAGAEARKKQMAEQAQKRNKNND